VTATRSTWVAVAILLACVGTFVRLPQAFCQEQDVLRIFVLLRIAMAQAAKPGPVALLAVPESPRKGSGTPERQTAGAMLPEDVRRFFVAFDATALASAVSFVLVLVVTF
jgi:hypothetical protein